MHNDLDKGQHIYKYTTPLQFETIQNKEGIRLDRYYILSTDKDSWEMR